LLKGNVANSADLANEGRTTFRVGPSFDATQRGELGRANAVYDEKMTETEGFVENARIFAKKVALFRRALG
jgi:hypothetical protein